MQKQYCRPASSQYMINYNQGGQYPDTGPKVTGNACGKVGHFAQGMPLGEEMLPLWKPPASSSGLPTTSTPYRAGAKPKLRARGADTRTGEGRRPTPTSSSGHHSRYKLDLPTNRPGTKGVEPTQCERRKRGMLLIWSRIPSLS